MGCRCWNICCRITSYNVCYTKLLREAIIGDTDIHYSDPVDFSALVDTLLPLPVDKESVMGTNMKGLELLVRQCTKCRLSETRTNTVFAEGVNPARLMVIGEGPGAEEDASGRAFVGRAGKYLA